MKCVNDADVQEGTTDHSGYNTCTSGIYLFTIIVISGY